MCACTHTHTDSLVLLKIELDKTKQYVENVVSTVQANNKAAVDALKGMCLLVRDYVVQHAYHGRP